MCPPEARPAWRWTRGQEGRPGPGTDVQSTGKSTSELTRFDTTHSTMLDSGKNGSTTPSSESPRSAYCISGKKFSLPSMNRCLQEFTHFGQELPYAKLKPREGQDLHPPPPQNSLTWSTLQALPPLLDAPGSHD